ncbi:uncharacterized protein LOC111088886 [Limulus polyphemus]|uniref:Uncharacterized protein LOC111088886 n=1 Tax=Limulus polyphemus TaxID=6850 RepID=A0ABM1TIU3_LIMPO|nr:uncharacterized protein LOC111088886 [Limulus polyphemus]
MGKIKPIFMVLRPSNGHIWKIAFIVLLFLLTLGVGSSINNEQHERGSNNTMKNRIPRALFGSKKQQQGYYFPIASYNVKHHKPANDEYSYHKKPETWEYHGSYYYGFRPKKKNFKAKKAAAIALAGIPILLAPLLGLLIAPAALTIPTVTVTAGAAGRKRRRRYAEESEKERVQEIQAVASYLQKIHYDTDQQETMMANYLRCSGMLDKNDHCLEKLACEFSNPVNRRSPEIELTVSSILLGHLLRSKHIPMEFKARLKAAARFGRNFSGGCDVYVCEKIQSLIDENTAFQQDQLRRQRLLYAKQH